MKEFDLRDHLAFTAVWLDRNSQNFSKLIKNYKNTFLYTYICMYECATKTKGEQTICRRPRALLEETYCIYPASSRQVERRREVEGSQWVCVNWVCWESAATN